MKNTFLILLITFFLILTGCERKNFTTKSGVKVEIIKQGEGRTPKEGDIVTVHYLGKLQDSTKFDSSYDRGEPFTYQFGVGQVIQGWDDGVATMKVGGKSRFIIPPELGYGSREVGLIPANSTLIFDVELLGVK
ncbi:MAG: FKBP-type peptidyl-prolyl cis-trans isomerase [Bacteroidetes bacterium]|nr:FKBP-type peptidyl-prolyl cis-trans isomerase [Bacteroidota bacterium]